MRGALLAVVAALAVAGCNSDPCGGVTGFTCVTLHVTSQKVHSLNQLAIGSKLNGGMLQAEETPIAGGQTFNLPFTMALKYQLGESGNVALSAIAQTGNDLTAAGFTTFSLVSGMHTDVNLMLDMNVPTGGGMDMAMPQTGPDMAGIPDMGQPPLNLIVGGSFDFMSASANRLATISHANQTLQIYDLPSGQLRATLDSGVDNRSVRVSDGFVLYCASPAPIGTTGATSCTLKLWKTGDTSGTMLGTGVPFSSIRASSDGTVLAWLESIDVTGTKANAVTWFNGNKTVIATNMSVANAGALIYNNVIWGIVPSATAGQFDIARADAAGSTAVVRICTNCDQLVMKNDGTMVAARSSPSGGVGKLVVASSASATTANSLGMSSMGSGATADVAQLIDYFDAGSVMYFTTSGGGFNIREWTSSNNMVATRLGDGSAKGMWNDNGAFLCFYKTLDSNGVGDLWTLSSLSGSPTLFDSGGKLYDLTSDGRFTFQKEPSTATSTWFSEVGSPGQQPIQLNAPSTNARIVNPTRVAAFGSGDQWLLGDYKSGVSFSAMHVTEYQADLALNRILLLFSGSGFDGVYVYSF